MGGVPRRIPLLVTLVWDDEVPPAGGCRAYAHRDLPFVATKAVWAYTGIAQGVCAILRVLFAVPQSAYMGDFLLALPARWAALCERAFQRVHAILGIPLKEGKDKVARRIEALGHTVAASHGLVRVGGKSKCLALVEAPMMNCFKQREPLIVGGHLNFASIATAGKVGTAFTRTIMGAELQSLAFFSKYFLSSSGVFQHDGERGVSAFTYF